MIEEGKQSNADGQTTEERVEERWVKKVPASKILRKHLKSRLSNKNAPYI